jgi:hypothetical protein
MVWEFLGSEKTAAGDRGWCPRCGLLIHADGGTVFWYWANGYRVGVGSGCSRFLADGEAPGRSWPVCRQAGWLGFRIYRESREQALRSFKRV